jgi:hypothetical protein
MVVLSTQISVAVRLKVIAGVASLVPALTVLKVVVEARARQVVVALVHQAARVN